MGTKLDSLWIGHVKLRKKVKFDIEKPDLKRFEASLISPQECDCRILPFHPQFCRKPVTILTERTISPDLS